MGLTLHTEIIRINHLEEDLFNFFENFDCDVTGQNGKDYTVPEAVELGYNSSVEYWIDEAKKKHDNPKDIVQSVLWDVENTYSSGEYIGAETSVIETKDGIVIAFAYADKD